MVLKTMSLLELYQSGKSRLKYVKIEMALFYFDIGKNDVLNIVWKYAKIFNKGNNNK